MLFKEVVGNNVDSSSQQTNPTRIPSLPKLQDASTSFISYLISLIMSHNFIKENTSDCLASRLVYGLQVWVCVTQEKKHLKENQFFVDWLLKDKGRNERHQDDKELNNLDDFIYNRTVQT